MQKTLLGALLAVAAVGSLAAQENWCTDHGWHSGYAVHTETREEHIAVAGNNEINPDMNGSVRVHAWANSDILVKACVQAAASDQAAAQAIAKQVKITDGPGRAVASGPEVHGDNTWWSVSYDIYAPASAALEMTSHNGSIHVEGMNGHITAHALNGSVTLKDSSGDVDAETTNGSVSLNVISNTSATGLKLRSTNGSIHLQLPAAFNADVEASTVNGSVKSDFAEPESGERHHHREMHFTIGSGGPKIEAETVNGSVNISRT